MTYEDIPAGCYTPEHWLMVQGKEPFIKPWMPRKGEQVLCLYETVRDGRGFVLGGVRPWQ